jgi:hypothetical protein
MRGFPGYQDEATVSRQYAPRAVLRHLPLDLVRDFLANQSIPTDPGWDALTEGDHQAVYQAWLELPPGPRERVEQMFREVHEVATPAGVRAMVGEANHWGHDIAELVGAIEGYHAQALWVLLRYPLVFHTARLLLAAANPGGRFWTLFPGFPGKPPDSSPTALQNLRLGVTFLYRTEQGRGQRCTIEDYHRGGRLYLFVYLDDYTQTHVGHNARGTLVRTPVRPAFEVVYLYDPAAGTLHLYAHGDRRWRTELVSLFCYHILDDTLPAGQPERRPYELNHLLDRSFPLATDPADRVHRSAVRKLRVGVRGSNRRVVLEADPAGGPDDVYEMLDDHFPADRFPRDDLFVNLVTFNLRYTAPGDPRERSLTFEVSWPDSCNLHSLPEDQRALGERCLRRWGIIDDDPADGLDHPGRVA